MAPQKFSGEGVLWALVIGFLVLVAGYLLYQKRQQASPPPPQPPPIKASSPAPAIIIAPDPTPLPTPLPASTPEPTATPKALSQATPTPEALPSLTKLGRAQLPLQIKLTKPVAFAITVRGQRAGTANAPAGVLVRLTGVRSDELIDVQFQQTVQTVPADSTDIFQRVRDLSRYAVSTAATPVPAKFAGFSKSLAGASVARKDPAPARPGTLLQEDFEDGTGWAGVLPESIGTTDTAGAKEPSLGQRSRETITSGPISVKSDETDLGKLTLAFSLSANAARPVTVRIESFAETKSRTGGLETVIYPAAPDFYQRHALDLSTFQPSGAGKFVPDAPWLAFTFSVEGAEWKGVEKPEIRLDNVHYAAPAFYVSANGSDEQSGRSEKSAFATPQKALDQAGPGDIILVMDGTYTATQGRDSVASFKNPGTPAAWITLKNHPGHKPVLSAVKVWNAVKIGSQDQGPEAALAYLEVRGLHVRGDSDLAKEKYPDLIGEVNPETNGNGISVDGRGHPHKPHHLRIAGNVVESCSGGGINVIEADWAYVENNISRNNCWWMVYAGSGISFLEGDNFDGTKGTYRRLIRNNITSGNRCFVPWKKIGKISDGNGIIIDTSYDGKGKSYTGRTLIQSNLSFNNGGSGIHCFRSEYVDIINNTAYLNGASPELRWGQIFLQKTNDAQVINNILWARDGQPVNTVGINANDKENTEVERAHNLYFGGLDPIMGKGDRIGDPKFVNPSTDPAVADFHLKAGSRAMGAARLEPFSPFIDLDGKARGSNPDVGAYQQ